MGAIVFACIILGTSIGILLTSKIDGRVIKKNDWELRHADSDQWDINWVDEWTNKIAYTTSENVWYEVWYSASRNLYKIEMGGYKPKENDKYIEVVNKMAAMRKETDLINNQRKKVDRAQTKG